MPSYAERIKPTAESVAKNPNGLESLSQDSSKMFAALGANLWSGYLRRDGRCGRDSHVLLGSVIEAECSACTSTVFT